MAYGPELLLRKQKIEKKNSQYSKIVLELVCDVRIPRKVISFNVEKEEASELSNVFPHKDFITSRIQRLGRKELNNINFIVCKIHYVIMIITYHIFSQTIN